MRFPASFAAYVTGSRGHLQGEICTVQLESTEEEGLDEFIAVDQKIVLYYHLCIC
jgi:hypothetical protein